MRRISGFSLFSPARQAVRPQSIGGSVPSRNTTILALRRDDKVIMLGDGRCTAGGMIVKDESVKVRRIGNILVGFAGSVADGFTLIDIFGKKLSEHPDNLLKAAVELAKTWRTTRALRHLEASIVVANKHFSLDIDGKGNVIRADGPVTAVGSGGGFALAAAKTLIQAHADGTAGAQHLSVEEIGARAMQIATTMDSASGGRVISEVLDLNNLRGDGSDLPPGTKGYSLGSIAADRLGPGKIPEEEEDDD